MTPSERFDRSKLAIETKLRRADQRLAQRQFQLSLDQFEWQKKEARQGGWRALLTPTGVVIVGAALGLIGTAAGKWADYLTTKRQQETNIILKASEVPQSLDLEAQEAQRASNLLFFAEAKYIDLPDSYIARLRLTSHIKEGQAPPPPIVQSQTPASAIDLITKEEGFQAQARATPDTDLKVIGYGHVLTAVEKSSGKLRVGSDFISFEDGISEDQARKILQQDLAPAYAAIDELVKVKLSVKQRDALASFIYNVGIARFRTSSLLHSINERDFDAVAEQLMRWSVVNGKELPGLKQRRLDELALWRSGADEGVKK